MAKKIALGKGMGSLLQAANSEIVKTTYEKEFGSLPESASGPMGPLMVNVENIIANPNQPRKIFKEKELEELSDSIREMGVIQPLIVSENGSKFELIAGERRLKASKLAGLEQVPVVIKRGTTSEKMVMAIIENIQRSDLNCVEIALAYFELQDNFQLTQEELAKKLGKERSSVANYLRLLKLPREVINLLRKENLTFGHAKILTGLKDEERAIRIANEVVVKELSVRELVLLVKKKSKIIQEPAQRGFSDEKLQEYRDKLEQKTGFHIKLKSKKNGSGQVIINFGNEAEFNDIFETMVTKLG